MAMTARGKRQDAPDTAELEVRLARAERMVTILLSIINRDIVRNRPGMPGATYQRIMIDEQRLCSHEEFAEIERWFADHSGGR